MSNVSNALFRDNVSDWSFRVEDKNSSNVNKEASEVLNGLVEKVRFDITSYVIDVVGLEDGENASIFYNWIESTIFLKLLGELKKSTSDNIEIKLIARFENDEDGEVNEVIVNDPLIDSLQAMECLDDQNFANVSEAQSPIKDFIGVSRLPSDVLKEFIDKL